LIGKEKDISINALQNSGRMRNISRVRKTLALKLVDGSPAIKARGKKLLKTLG